MQRMGPLLCFWTGGIRRAEQKMPQCGIFPPWGAMARSCAAWKANSKRPARRIPPSPPRRSKLCIACSGFFHFIPKSRSALTPLLLLSAKGSAWLACSLASALTTARRRCQPFAGPVRAHAAHGPSALLLDRWDSKGGTGEAPVEPRPAPGRTGKRLRRAERKQAAARAENPTLLREQAGRAHAAHGPSALLLDRWDSKGGTGEAPVEPRPAPGRTGKRLRRAERKQAAARAENPTLSAMLRRHF